MILSFGIARTMLGKLTREPDFVIARQRQCRKRFGQRPETTREQGIWANEEEILLLF